MKQRLRKLRDTISQFKVDALIVQKHENRQYFSGFTGSAGILLVTPQEAFLLTDFRYTEQASKQAREYEILQHKSPILDELQALAAKLNLKNIGFEDAFLPVAQFNLLKAKLKEVQLIPLKESLDNHRRVKDNYEISLLQEAINISDKAFTHILGILKPGISEKEVALELEYFMRKEGASKTAFDTIVASGTRSSLPHGIASDKIIEVGDFVTMDFGAVFNGYHSDITRTVVIGEVSKKQREIYSIVLEAQRLAIGALKTGKTTKEIDSLARDHISKHGFVNNFGHGLGHGVGLEIHEKPALSPHDETTLVKGMVVTVEPGIYLPNWGGVRIEDVVVLTEDGCDVLTNSTKELLII